MTAAPESAELQPPAGPGKGQPRSAQARRSGPRALTGYALLLAWVAIIILFAILDGGTFLSAGDFESIFATQSTLLILAISLIPPFCAGEFDLSIAGTMGLVYVLFGALTINAHWSLVAALLLCLVVALAIGAMNAFLVVRLGLESIVVTLGTGTLLYGLGYAVTSGPIVGVPPGLVNAMDFHIGPLPVEFYIAVLLTLVMWYLLSWTPLGRYVYVVGSSRDVARLSGLPVNQIRAGTFFAAALVAGIAGIVLAGATGGADPSTASAYLLEAFAAVFLGATTIIPGRFNAPGTFVAVYFLSTGVAGLEIRGLTGWVEQVFYGAALVLGIAVSRLIGLVTKVRTS